MMDNELLIKILAKQEVLEHRLNVQEKLLHILIQAVPEEQRQDLESLVKAYREFASASGDQQCARGIELILTEALAPGANIKDATNCFHFQAQLLSDVPEHQKEAMISWLSTATVDEIVDEFSLSRNQLLPGDAHPGFPDDEKGEK
ncbi:TPA: hypothetical protein MII19_16050 [Klebsiella pneumoniae]|uniref:hypothetical protein n=1 Tax=Klebsiella TaxID=570 RepID=UPI00289160DA|nr:hypothetical protein [Klebsiella pneumoniae]HDX8710307.1 hypothetical protein [Klebsiella michiganensis]HBX8459030.1 hypothetical protein [Klebsiella pneumoniae]HBX8481266.1 hypothetical protein [Klebsiella pneumoniae]HBX8491800.1 hypothetical protein [Klebsiella pneumoniae]